MDDMDLPQRAPRLGEQIYDALRQQVHLGRFPPAGVTEAGLAAAMQVSRTPVREALLELCREGVLERDGRHFRLPRLDRADRKEIAEIRLVLDPLMAALAVERADPAHVAALRDALAAETRAHAEGDPAAFVTAHTAFRRALREATGNRRLGVLVLLLDDLIQRIRIQTHSIPQNREVTIQTHGRILTAVETGDVEAGRQAMTDLMTVASDYVHALPPDGGAPTPQD